MINEKIHIEIISLEVEKSTIRGISNEISVFNKVSNIDRGAEIMTPEVIIAVVTASSIVIRQLIISLFDYLKVGNNRIIKIKIDGSEIIVKNRDLKDEKFLSEIVAKLKDSRSNITIEGNPPMSG